MSKRLLFILLLASTVLAAVPVFAAEKVDHVLLISVDGLHDVDVANYVAGHPGSALAELASHGTTFTQARLPGNSDSFPGLLALVTGGAPVSTGVFYDVAYNRSFFDPSNLDCHGAAGAPQVFDETIDIYAGVVSQNVIDPAQLPRRASNGVCGPVYPHSALLTNTIFEVAHDAGRLTAWADKHPAYDLVNGPSGHGVDDLYTPEITNAPDGGFDATVSVVCTAQNDRLKVQAILNEIHGYNHDMSAHPGTPAIFGMNFQAVSVGQKLAKEKSPAPCGPDALTGQRGGYLDAAGTPTAVLNYGLNSVDKALGDMIQALKAEDKYENTLFIVSAKHGQTPIDPALVRKPGHFADLVSAINDGTDAPAQILSAANCPSGNCGFVQDDDVALIWLADQSKTAEVVQWLNAHAGPLYIQQVIAGNDLQERFGDPLHDSSTPDVIVQPIPGTIYTGSSKKNAEHGGLADTDIHVGLIVSNPNLPQRTIPAPVRTSQVAPTILKVLGLDPRALGAVRKEHTAVLPSLGLGSGDQD